MAVCVRSSIFRDSSKPCGSRMFHGFIRCGFPSLAPMFRRSVSMARIRSDGEKPSDSARVVGMVLLIRSASPFRGGRRRSQSLRTKDSTRDGPRLRMRFHCDVHSQLALNSIPGSCGLTDPCARIPSLSDLMQPLYCKVCDAKLNGRLQASAHYDGKSHHRRLRQYLEKAGRATDLQKLNELHQQKKVGAL